MKIELRNAGKRFNREWIFRKANLVFESNTAYAITGANGSGKSTLLQCLGGMLQLSEGETKYEVRSKKYEASSEFEVLPSEKAYQQISFSAPYLDVIEEMTLLEFLRFHQQFKPFLAGWSPERIIQLISLEAAAQKQIRNFSSGMKQRVKLAQCILSNTAIVLLDEPCSNLDTKGIELYQQMISEFTQNRLVIVCSNDPVEYSFCREVIAMSSFK